ncbi:MAG TPA: alpha/beta fold hydrolase [Steroidobacteraceae bacterium]
MAAHYWRLLLLGELGFAIAMATLGRTAFQIPLGMAILTGLGVLLLLPGILAGVSFVLARLMRHSKHPSQDFIGSLSAWIRESMALGWASIAMSAEPCRRFPYDDSRGAASLPARKTRGPDNPVLLIHGVTCNRGVWHPMARALHARGFGPIRAVNLEPLLGNIDSHAAGVADEIRRLRRDCGGARVAIVAHSMGGLVARAALAHLAPDDISRIVTLGSPHHGSVLARILPGLPYRQMEPDSNWLADLNAAQEGHFPVPVTCIYSSNDNLVRPTWSCALEGATRVELEGLGHLSLLSARRAIDSTLSALTDSPAARQPCLT